MGRGDDGQECIRGAVHALLPACLSSLGTFGTGEGDRDGGAPPLNDIEVFANHGGCSWDSPAGIDAIEPPILDRLELCWSRVTSASTVCGDASDSGQDRLKGEVLLAVGTWFGTGSALKLH